MCDPASLVIKESFRLKYYSRPDNNKETHKNEDIKKNIFLIGFVSIMSLTTSHIHSANTLTYHISSINYM